MFRTARWRLVTWNVVVLSLILLFLGLAFYGFYYTNLFKEVDQELTTQQTRAVGILDQYGTINALYYLATDPASADYTMVAVNPNMNVIYSGCPQKLINRSACPQMQPISTAAILAVLRSAQTYRGPLPADAVTDVRTATVHGTHVRVRTFAVPSLLPPGPDVIQVARSVEPERNSIAEMRTLLLYGSLLGILLSAVGSLFLANRAFVPIRQAFRRQRQFTADASHELRTPLALIRANAEMVLRHSERIPEEDAELIGEILNETDHLNRLVTDLLTLARADADSLRLENRPVDLRALVENVEADIKPIAAANNIQSEASLNGPVTVIGDEVRLRQLLLILLDNAIKYTGSGGRVSVSLDRENGRARLIVSDTGIGIPAEDLPHIFERFYRVDRAREHETGGTGLGLAIAQWIVEAHNGTITARSAPAEGTTFEIELPAGNGRPASLTPEEVTAT